MGTSDDELNKTTFEIYLYLVNANEALGPREIMRGTNITSPGVVHRHLQKLSDQGLVIKDAYGRYEIKEKVRFKGYVWLGKNLIPRFMMYAFFFIGLFCILIIGLVLHLEVGSPIEESFSLLTIITGVAALAFFIEGLILRKRLPKLPVGI